MIRWTLKWLSKCWIILTEQVYRAASHAEMETEQITSSRCWWQEAEDQLEMVTSSPLGFLQPKQLVLLHPKAFPCWNTSVFGFPGSAGNHKAARGHPQGEVQHQQQGWSEVWLLSSPQLAKAALLRAQTPCWCSVPDTGCWTAPPLPWILWHRSCIAVPDEERF